MIVLREVAARVLGAVLVVWLSVTLLFVVFHVLPGNGVDAVLAGERVATPQQRLQVERNFGLDRPLVVQYGKYWNAILRGDLGTSFATGRPVSSMIGEAVPASLRLAFWAFVLELLIGVGLAAIAYSRRRVRAYLTAISVFAVAVPVFVAGYVLQLVFGVYTAQHHWPKWLRFPVQGDGVDRWLFVFPTGSEWRSLLLPALTLAIVSSAVLFRLAVSTFRTVADAPHVNGARARGVSERVIFRRHILRNAALPLLTFVGADLVALFGSAVLTETVFNWPGVGSVIARAMERQDVPVVLGSAIVLAVTYVLVNTVVDIAYRFVDPRLRRHAS